MIKKYNQFRKERINESDDFDLENTERQESNLANADLDVEFDGLDGEEEEAGDIYITKLKEVADKLGSKVVDGKVEYEGKKIIFPSETEMYHVGNKKFKTSDEVVSYFDKGGEDELKESKSYKKDILNALFFTKSE